jgi:hypothetical protein
MLNGALTAKGRVLTAGIEKILRDLERRLRLVSIKSPSRHPQLTSGARTLETDALSSHRTSFIGIAMEDAYNHARYENGNYHPSISLNPIVLYVQPLKYRKGRGSHSRRIYHINSAITRNGLFTDLLRAFKAEFNKHTDDTQTGIGNLIDSQFEEIRGTLDIIRNDNAVLESERDPEFRRRVQEALETTRNEIQQICASIDL